MCTILRMKGLQDAHTESSVGSSLRQNCVPSTDFRALGSSLGFKMQMTTTAQQKCTLLCV